MPEKATCTLFGNFNGFHTDKFDATNAGLHAGGTFTLVESKISASSVRKFRIRILAEKGNSGDPRLLGAIKKIFIDFFGKSGGKHVGTVELNRDGSALLSASTSSPDPEPALIEGFNFRKIGKLLNVITDFGVEVTMHGRNVNIRVPYKEYFDKVEGICGNIMYESDRHGCEENGVHETDNI